QKPYDIPNSPNANLAAPLTTLAVFIDGTRVNLDNVPWKLEQSSTTSATYSVDVTDNGSPLATVRKTYTIQPESSDKSKVGLGYEIHVRQELINRTDHPLRLKALMTGTNAAASENRND